VREARGTLGSTVSLDSVGEDRRFQLRHEDPFVAPPEARDAARRLRGHLAQPVTVWTAGEPGEPAGLTVSSLLVAEGEPAHVLGLVGTHTDLLEAAQRSGAFIVHVLEEPDERLAARFAGAYPGDPFEGLDLAWTEWGPRLAGARSVASCRLVGIEQVGYQQLVRGVIEQVTIGEDRLPLLHQLGRYRALRHER